MSPVIDEQSRVIFSRMESAVRGPDEGAMRTIVVLHKGVVYRLLSIVYRVSSIVYYVRIGLASRSRSSSSSGQSPQTAPMRMTSSGAAAPVGGVNGSPIANRSFEEVNVATGTLTEREKQIVRFIAEDRSSNEIAASLNISLKTVQFHRKAIMAKTRSERN